MIMSWNKHRNTEGDPSMVYVVKEMTKKFRNTNSVVIADSAFESNQIMEWGRDADNQIAYVMTFGGRNKCHPEYFKSKTSKVNKYMKEKCERGAMFITHWDNGTFTTVRDSAVLRIVDNDLDWRTKTPRVVRRFNKKKKKGEGRWKGLGKVSSVLILIILFDLRSM